VRLLSRRDRPMLALGSTSPREFGRRLRLVDPTSPLVLFPGLYVAYFALGSVNVFPYRGEIGPPVVFLWLAALGAYVAACAAVMRWRSNVRAFLFGLGRHGLGEPAHVSALTAAFFGVGTAGVLTTFLMMGIPLLRGEERLQASGWALGAAHGWTVALALYAYRTRLRRRRDRTVIVGLGLLLLLLGFRTPVLLIILVVLHVLLVEYQVRVRPRLLVLVLAAAVVSSWISVFRFGAGPEAYFRMLINQGMPLWFAPLAPLWITAREGVGVLARLMDQIPGVMPFQFGRIEMSVLETLLPGRQPGPRLLVAQIVGGRPGITLTPSILGAPYADFGLAGTMAFMALVGVVLSLLRIRMEHSSTWAPAAAYSYTHSILLLSIHSGLLDLVVLVSFICLIGYARYAEVQCLKDRRGTEG
jgi:uncharacterized membrane protein